MWISVGTFVVLLVLIGLWLQQMKSRERALSVAKHACESKQAQLVDETVHFKGFRFSRGVGARLVIECRYDFEYSTDGQRRDPGRVLLRGSMVKQVRMEDRSTEIALSGKEAVIVPFRRREPRNE